MKTTALLLLVLFLPFVSRAVEAPTPPVPGPLAFQTAEYKFEAKTDPDILATAATELWARAFWPTDLSKPHPIVFLLHGNHVTCRNDLTKDDSDCTYTREGTCPTGTTVIANHEGYNYLAQQLASLGYIAVTINANRGITCGDGDEKDWGLNLARGRLVLRHIELWNQWATQGGAPSSLGLAPDAFVGKVDLNQVGLMGHSRGGEGMRAAAALYRDAGSIWPARIPNLQIRGIFEIGSVDGQAGRVLDADDMAWNQILPMCDGDVSDLAGRLPFERMLRKSSEIHKTPKSLTMVWGADHNFFNTQWNTDESTACLDHSEIHGPGPTSDKQQTIAATAISAFMLANVGATRDAKMGEFFDSSYSVPSSLTSITRIDRDNVFTFDRNYDAVVDDFDQASGLSSNHKNNAANGVTVANNTTELPNRGEIAWAASGADHFVQLNWTDAGAGRDISTFTSLDLRVGRPLDQLHEAASEFSIALVDGNGKLSNTIPVANYATLTGPGSEVNLYQTIRVPVADFKLPAGFLVQGVRLVFDRSAKGSLYFANVRFASNNPAAFAAGADLPLMPESIIATPAPADSVLPSLPGSSTSSSGAPSVLIPDGKVTPNFDPFGSVVLNTAKLSYIESVASSSYLSGHAAVELTVRAQGSVFKPEAQLPTLVMAGHKFSVSRYSSTGKLDRLIFSVPQKDISRLPENGSMWVQYGRVNPRKIWNLPPFEKSQLNR